MASPGVRSPQHSLQSSSSVASAAAAWVAALAASPEDEGEQMLKNLLCPSYSRECCVVLLRVERICDFRPQASYRHLPGRISKHDITFAETNLPLDVLLA